MTERLGDVTASLRRCLDHPDFVDRFLERLGGRAPGLRTCIESNVDAGGLRIMAQRCMTTVILAVAGVVSPEEARRKFGECRDSGGVGMTTELYPVWTACLLEAVREFDPEMDDALADAWNKALSAAGGRLELCGAGSGGCSRANGIPCCPNPVLAR